MVRTGAVLHAYDRSLLLRSFGIAVLASLLVLLVVVTTDEGAVFAKRLALWSALAPLAGALGTLGAASVARARGETRGLEALGVSPSRALLGAMLGGVVVGFVGVAIVFAGASDLEPLFPRPRESTTWVLDPEGGMKEITRGVSLRPQRQLVVVPRASRALRALSETALDVSDERRRALAVALLLLSFAAPLSAISPAVSLGRGVVLVGLVLMMIAVFQFVSAGLVGVWLVCFPPLGLLANGLWPRYGPRLSR